MGPLGFHGEYTTSTLLLGGESKYPFQDAVLELLKDKPIAQSASVHSTSPPDTWYSLIGHFVYLAARLPGAQTLPRPTKKTLQQQQKQQAPAPSALATQKINY